MDQELDRTINPFDDPRNDHINRSFEEALEEFLGDADACREYEEWLDSRGEEHK